MVEKKTLISNKAAEIFTYLSSYLGSKKYRQFLAISRKLRSTQHQIRQQKQLLKDQSVQIKLLEQKANTFNALKNASEDDFLLIDKNGTILESHFINKSITSASISTINSGSTIFDIFPKELAVSYSETIHRALDDMEIKKIQYEVNTFKGIQYFEAKFSPVSATHVVAILNDQTDSIQKKNTIKEKDDWFRTIFNTSRDGLVVELNEEIIIVNDAFVSLYGYKSKEELIGQKISIIHSNEHDAMMLDYGKRRLKGEPVPDVYEAKGKCKNGDIIDIEVTASIFELQNEKYIVATNRNISERKKTKRELLAQNEELKKINAELDKFVYSASHDLRAPLRSLLGLIQLVRKDKNQHNQNAYLDRMDRSIHNLDKFTQDIIQYSRNSRLELSLESFSLHSLVIAAMEDLRYLIPEDKSIEINIEVDPNFLIVSDKYRVKVLLNNLLSNALRYHAPKRVNSFVKISATKTENAFVIKVQDNGIGIDQERIAHIFKMFYRAHDKNVGTGLGLYIAKETMNVLKGEIIVTSEINKGTLFELRLPLN